ncbi:MULTISPECIES: hypothetical protein [Streptomyces]|uniref:Uncharacterized protein n=1 Tax=Streptomyces siderophoricus TaxID=2802281 RepID=A0ABS1N010_9ACTN|nr:hypothetical protein [Streptomyces sp. 9-7]MBL1093379.1 hypothetical protein [Streptomyces sp. 9-7]
MAFSEGADSPDRGRPWKLSLEDREEVSDAAWRANDSISDAALRQHITEALHSDAAMTGRLTVAQPRPTAGDSERWGQTGADAPTRRTTPSTADTHISGTSLREMPVCRASRVVSAIRGGAP